MKNNRSEEILLECSALLEGHFLLTSGRHSKNYLQCAKILQEPRYAIELISHIKELIITNGLDVDFIISPAIGGIIVGYELARQLCKKSMFAERENGKMTLRRGFIIPKGASFGIAEDVITTGGSCREIFDIVDSFGGNVKFVSCLIDRTNGNVDFGVPLFSAYQSNATSYSSDECPICKEGKEKLVKPGSKII